MAWLQEEREQSGLSHKSSPSKAKPGLYCTSDSFLMNRPGSINLIVKKKKNA